jgi:hypothetical protein
MGMSSIYPKLALSKRSLAILKHFAGCQFIVLKTLAPKAIAILRSSLLSA